MIGVGPRAAGPRGGGAVPRGGHAVPGAPQAGARARARAHGAALPRAQARRAPPRAAAAQDHRGAQGVHREAQLRARGGGAAVWTAPLSSTAIIIEN